MGDYGAQNGSARAAPVTRGKACGRVTLRDIARRLGLSHATVSRALNGRDDPFISAATRVRVQAAAREMGYHPNGAARALATGRSGVVRLWLMERHSPYITMIERTLNASLQQAGYDVLISDADTVEPEPSARQDPFGPWPSDAVFTNASTPWIRAFLVHNPDWQTPLVALGAGSGESWDGVNLDLAPAARDAVRHLLAAGARSVGYVVPAPRLHDAEPRCEGYRSIIGEAGQVPRYLSTVENTRGAAHAAVLAAGRSGPLPEALFCYNDELAIGTLCALHDLGRRVPEDVALVGCDGIPETEFHRPRISTLLVPVAEMCETAWRLLQRRLADPAAPPQGVCFRPRLVIRESSRRHFLSSRQDESPGVVAIKGDMECDASTALP
jgi:LacI family transcriptional regulator